MRRVATFWFLLVMTLAAGHAMPTVASGPERAKAARIVWIAQHAQGDYVETPDSPLVFREPRPVQRPAAWPAPKSHRELSHSLFQRPPPTAILD